MSKPQFEIALAIVRRDGRWLVAKRSPEVHLGGLWEFPGGKRELGESPAQAAVRELHEECGVEAVAERVLPVVWWEYPDRVVHLTPVLCRWQSGTARALRSAECRWVRTRELRALDMPTVNARIIRDVESAV